MPDVQVLATNRKSNYLARRQVRSATQIVILKAQVGQLAYRVQKRLLRLNRAAMAATDPKAMALLNDSCLRCEELILRIVGHPLPGRARVTNERMRTLDIEPMGALTPPAEPVDYGMDYGPNGTTDSLGKTDSTG